AEELQYFAALSRDRVADAFEMLVEPTHDLRARRAVDEGGEAAEIRQQQGCRNHLTVAAADPALQHMRSGVRTEIRGERLGGDAREIHSISGDAERREDAADRRHIGVAKAARTVRRRGKRRAPKGGATL